MNKIFILLLLLCLSLHGQIVDTLGNTDIYASVGGIGADYAVLMVLETASYSGSLQKAFIFHTGSAASEVKMSVFLDDGDETPNAGDTFIAISGVLTAGNDSWDEATFVSGGNIIAGNKYWIMINRNPASSNNYPYVYQSGGSNYWRLGATGFWNSTPSNLGATTWSAITRLISAYITVTREQEVEDVEKSSFDKFNTYKDYIK